MAIYLVSFVISFSIVKAIEKWSTASVGFWLWSAVALLIPCLIAGMRAETVGTDVTVYVKPLYDLAANSTSFSDYYSSVWWNVFRYTGPDDYEIGFSVLVWLSANTGLGFSFVLFMIQAFTICPIYFALVRFRNREFISIAVGLLVYFLLYFNVSLNLMRQWIAMGFLLLAITYLLDQKKIQYLIFSIIAFLFHDSAIIASLVIYVLWRYICKRNEGYASRVLIASSVSCLVVVFGLRVIVSILILFGFSGYVQYIGSGEVELVVSQLLLLLPGVLLILIFWNNKCQTKAEVYLLLLTMVIGVIASQLGSITDQSSRLAQYFSYQAILAFPLLYALISDRDKKILYSVLCFSYCLGYWIVVYTVMGANQTVPYIFG